MDADFSLESHGVSPVQAKFTPVQGLIGGMTLGAGAAAVALLTGRVAGISGFCHGLVSRSPDWRWRGLFVAGLMSGGALYNQFDPQQLPVHRGESERATLLRMAGSGLLVGLGSVIGNGCTSGHGVCGLARLSPRSLFHVLTFMSIGCLTAKLTDPVAALEPKIARDTREPIWSHPSLPSTNAEKGAIFFTLSLVCLSIPALMAGARWASSVKPRASATATMVETAKASYYASHATAFITGLMFSGGLVLSGMTDPMKVASFLDVGKPYWDPSLAFVMVGAIGVAMPAFARLVKWKKLGRGPLLPGETNRVPPASWAVDKNLFIGASLFGAGWGLGGVCPGPGLVQVGAHPTDVVPIVFAASMLVGMRAAYPAAHFLRLM
eukprot:m.243663 g.243663  ORF g.243663 m.243663 type:complete len:380 (+) comp28214_c0_seq1:97-1236(+)